MNILHTKIYPSLFAAGLTTTMTSFSREWLGRDGRYLTMMKNKPATTEALKAILPKLRAKGLHDLAMIVSAELVL